MALAKFNSSSNAGFSLIESLIAVMLMAGAIATLAQLFALSTRTNVSAHYTTFAAVLAEQKLEELRALSWGFDTQGLPMSDTSTDTTVSPETAIGGTGLQPSPSAALSENTVGYVDYVDAYGTKVQPGAGGNQTSSSIVYTRRWSITPLPTNPNNTLVIQVLVTRNKDRGQADQGDVARLPEEARMIAVRTRKAK